ncbi:polysaccharide deacetylase family protein [Crateriforma conspicua]|uniref:polysaccharide deacetylase family protein n=1 Tax=Crateriforma conspicua TaxID=2527996 RepID=UPI00118A44A9|nr:polysaccharide deacetylase family protein [Crateriforma conspicua]QDV64915.1 Polysaccharide deacetylase [Crateriforma conspicua]
MNRPIASLSLDLDNRWAYLRAAGRDDWMNRPSYLPMAVDRIVDVLGELNLPLTVFLVGRDLTNKADCDAIRRFDSIHWEPANHSLNHLPWMHTMPPDQIEEEIAITETRIVDLLGIRPYGFRGPGFSCPPEVLSVLQERGYLYDASSFPTSVAPIARWFFMLKTGLKGQQKDKAKQLYGGFGSMLKPNRPHRLHNTAPEFWEIPVSVMPLTRLPIHMSYLCYLASFSVAAAKMYFSSVVRLATLTGTPISLLLHPPDFFGHEDADDLSYLPGMSMARDDKLRFVRWALESLSGRFEVRRMIDQLHSLAPETVSAITQADLKHHESGESHSPVPDRVVDAATTP